MKRRIALIAALPGMLAGCGSTRDAPPVLADPLVAYSCTVPGAPLPPAKLILHPSGLPNRFIVVLVSGSGPVQGLAETLANRYGVELRGTFATVPGFAVAGTEAQASALSSDSDVCFVEQDALTTGT